MSKNTEAKANKFWSISFGTYPGILFGVRTYNNEKHIQYVIYLPLIDISIEIEK